MNKNINLGGSKDKPQILENIIVLGDNTMEKKENLITRYVKSQYNFAAIEMPAMYDGVRNMICSVPATVLINHFEVPYARGPIANMEGYQRDFSKARINKLADRLIKELISLPLSISVNILEANAFNLFKNGKFTYNPSMHKSLRVMDGQHRILGLKEAFRRVLESEETDENLSSARDLVGGRGLFIVRRSGRTGNHCSGPDRAIVIARLAGCFCDYHHICRQSAGGQVSDRGSRR